MMRILFVLILLAFSSCHRSKDLNQSPILPEEVSSQIPAVITEMGFARETDPCRIYSLFVEGTILNIGIEYSGGCKEHAFELYTDGVIMKSLPPKQRFFLKHDSDNDMCKSLVRDTLVFDLNGIRPAGTELVVILESFDDEVGVVF